MDILGIDIGGSGIKGAPVNVSTGKLRADRFRLPTPAPSRPKAVADTVAEIVRHFEWSKPLGCTFPAIVRDGITYSAANVDKAWVGKDGRELLESKTGCPVLLINDADAAGLAEMRFGAGRKEKGVVLVLTFGTGIGSALFCQGMLVPNTELGHLELNGQDAEWRASDRARQANDLGWKKWAARVSEYLQLLEKLFSPDLFIIGGGVSKQHERFLPFLSTHTRVVPAQLLNDAGLIGAAWAARTLAQPAPRRRAA